MKVAIASGKGGTGKTAVTAALAKVWAGGVLAVDLDVEEPNLHLFLQPVDQIEQTAFIEIPQLDKKKCTACGLCSDFCQFKAIISLGKSMSVLPDICHGCGGCLILCPEKALLPDKRELGQVVSGQLEENGAFLMGNMRIGEAMSPPLMRQVRIKMQEYAAQNHCDVLIDSPPGISCPAMNAVADADVIILVTEPTPFGLFDLKLAVQAFSPLGKPVAVVINRYGIGTKDTEEFCREFSLPVIGKIPYAKEIARAYAHGRCITDVGPEYVALFKKLRQDILGLAQKHAQEVSHA